MAFTFTEDLSVARDFVRFHAEDTIEGESMLSDALIASLIATYGQNKAVIQALEYKIQRMNKPSFRADWLQVDPKAAVAELRKTLAEKRTLLGIPRFSASATHVYRADSAQTEESDYTDGRP